MKLSQACAIVMSTAFIALLFMPFTGLLYQKGYFPFILIAVGIISIPLGWEIYKRLWHCVFTYDEESFEFRKGRSEVIKGKWRDYTKTSLSRSARYEFNIRLYEDEQKYIELPVHKVKLDPFEFRLKVFEFIKRG